VNALALNQRSKCGLKGAIVFCALFSALSFPCVLPAAAVQLVLVARGLAAQAAGNSKPAPGATDVSNFPADLHKISVLLDKEASPQKVDELRRSLPKEWSISTTKREYTISSDFLRDQLSSGSREDAKAWVDNLESEVGSYSTKRPTSGNARAELQHILAGPEFNSVHPPTAWDRFRQRLAVRLARFLDWLFSGLNRYPIGGQILFWLVVAAGVGFIALWLFRLTASRDRMEALPPGHVAAVLRTWQEWIRFAREAANRGDFRDAVHCAYWAGIARLEVAGALPKDPTKTPREYLRSLSESSAPLAPGLNYHQPLSALTVRLEQAWYANRGASSEDFRDALRQLEALGCQLE
jgi:hypothetical protein